MLENTQFGQLGPYLQLLDMVERAVYLVNESGKIIALNAKATHQLAYSPEEATEKSIFEINPHYSFLNWKKIWQALTKGAHHREDTELMNRKGIVFPVEVQAIMLQVGQLQIACLIVEDKLETERYRDLLDLTARLSRIGCWELDFVHRKAIFTREAFSLIDRAEDQETFSLREARNLLQDIFHPVDVDRLQRLSQEAIASDSSFDLECQIVTETGQKRILNVRGVPQISEDQAAKLYGTIQDISDISARSEDMYMAKFVLEHMRDLILWVRQDGTLFYANDQACRTLGAPRKQIQGSQLFDWLPQPQAKEWPQFWQEMQKHGHLQAEMDLKTRQRKTILAQVNHHYLSYDSESFDCLIIRDITDQRQRDERIHLVHYTLNQSNDLIFWARRDGSIVYYNQSVPERLGYSPKELEHLDLFDLNPHLTKDDYQKAWSILEKEGILETSHPFYRSDGSSFYVDATTTYIHYQDEECCCITMRDITLRREQEIALQKALKENQKLRERAESQKTYLQEEVTSTHNFNNIISKSKNYHHILKQVAQVADTSSTVLIQGETGTGKELLARAIHGLSARDESPLVKVNCAALPADLIESELFGHEKGSFTGAYQQKIGKFELADGGTLFLDEVGEMPLELQPKLLRVLQEGAYERVGGTRTLHADVRVIAATNRNLEDMVRAGTFREDLFFRLNVFPIYNLPLRERKADIPLLIQHFLKKYSQRSGKKIDKVREKDVQDLMEYEFPGNIRELENLVERAVIISNDDVLDLQSIMPQPKSTDPHDSHHFPTLEEIQKEHILEALRRTRGRITGEQGAAHLLGMNGKTLASRMRKWNINRMDFLDKPMT